jgi:hypothetical protein
VDSGLKRGSVVLAIYPFTDLSSAKRRPALVVSASDRPGRDCILAFSPLARSQSRQLTWSWTVVIATLQQQDCGYSRVCAVGS